MNSFPLISAVQPQVRPQVSYVQQQSQGIQPNYANNNYQSAVAGTNYGIGTGSDPTQFLNLIIQFMSTLVNQFLGQQQGQPYAPGPQNPASYVNAPAGIQQPVQRPNFPPPVQQVPPVRPAPPVRPTPPPRPQGNGRLVIAQIDDFTISHGPTVENILTSGGNDPNLAGRVNVVRYNVGQGGNAPTSRIGDALQDVANRIRSGQQINAVNLSMEDFRSSEESARVRFLIDQIQGMGVPVAVAAGNSGMRNINQLAPQNAFIVESFNRFGQPNNTSGPGNEGAVSSTTSYATAQLTPVLAALQAQGVPINQIHAIV